MGTRPGAKKPWKPKLIPQSIAGATLLPQQRESQPQPLLPQHPPSPPIRYRYRDYYHYITWINLVLIVLVALYILVHSMREVGPASRAYIINEDIQDQIQMPFNLIPNEPAHVMSLSLKSINKKIQSYNVCCKRKGALICMGSQLDAYIENEDAKVRAIHPGLVGTPCTLFIVT